MIEDDGSHTDQNTIPDSAPVNDGRMTHRDMVSDVGGSAVVRDVHNSIVLYVRTRSDPDSVHIPTYGGRKPYGGIRTKVYVTDDSCGLGYEVGCIRFRCLSNEGSDHDMPIF
jgi:hypothetical protein